MQITYYGIRWYTLLFLLSVTRTRLCDDPLCSSWNCFHWNAYTVAQYWLGWYDRRLMRYCCIYACFRASYCAHVFVCVCNYWLLARLLAFNGTTVHMFHSYLHPTTDYAMEVRKKTTLVFEIKKQANCDYDYWNE